MKRSLLFITLLLGAIVLIAGCTEEKTTGREIELAPLSALPAQIQHSPTNVQEAYRFAVTNQELVSQFPCYCGCASVGHESNLDCYINEIEPDGSILFDDHAYG